MRVTYVLLNHLRTKAELRRKFHLRNSNFLVCRLKLIEIQRPTVADIFPTIFQGPPGMTLHGRCHAKRTRLCCTTTSPAATKHSWMCSETV